MSKIMVPQYVDDLTGERLGENGTTIAFSFQGHEYEIDLSPKNAEKMTNAFGEYIDHARKATSSRRGRRSGATGATSSTGTPDETKAARAWLVEHGHLSPEARGRISAENWERYRNRGQLSMESAPKDADTKMTVVAAKDDKPEANGTPKADGNSPTPAKKAAKAAEPATAKA